MSKIGKGETDTIKSAADAANERPEQRANRFFERAKQVIMIGSGSSIELERALKDALKAISFHADHVPHYLFLGKLYKYALDITSAIFCYRFVLRIEPANFQAKKFLTELLILKGKELMELAVKSCSTLRFRAARASFDEALELNRDDPQVWIMKAVCHIHCDELLEAYECLTRVIRQGVGLNAEIYILRAKIQWARGLTEQGNADIKIAARLDPDHTEVLAFTARSYARSERLYKESVKEFTAGKYKEALEAVNHAIYITTEDVKLLIMQSKIHRMMGDLQNAYDSMLRAKKLFEAASENSERPVMLPNDIVNQINLILNEMAISYAMKGDYSNAILLFNKVIKVEQSTSRGGLVSLNHQYFKNRGDCYRALSQYSDAIYDYEQALQIQPRDWAVSTRLSLTHYLVATNLFNNESKYLDAITELDKAINYNPKVAEYYALRGKSHYYVSDFKLAYEDFCTVMKLDPKNEEIKERLSQFDDFSDVPHKAKPSKDSKGEGAAETKAGAHKPSSKKHTAAKSPPPAWRGSGVVPSGAPYLTISAAVPPPDDALAARASVNKMKIDFSALPPTKHVEHVLEIKPLDEDVIDMMLLPNRAAKLPVLKLLSKSVETDLPKRVPKSEQLKAPAPGASVARPPAPHSLPDHLQAYNAYADLPPMQRTSAFKDAFKTALTVSSKRAAVEAIYEQKHDNTRGPLWGMVETAKTLAYRQSHPERNKYKIPDAKELLLERQQQRRRRSSAVTLAGSRAPPAQKHTAAAQTAAATAAGGGGGGGNKKTAAPTASINGSPSPRKMKSMRLSATS